jgi:signal peptidase I
MRPAYQPGDMAFLYVGKNIQVNTGDVVFFSADGYPTLHRAINIENGAITTQGDANPAPDEKIITRVDGKLLFAIPKIGYAIDVIRISINNLAQWVRGSG